jgi:hypothetical protein
MLKKIFIGILAAALVFFGLVALQPAEFRIERSLSIGASRESVYALVSDLHRWPAWSPWAHLDPQMKVSYSGAVSGAGSSMSWEGNRQAGMGKMTILVTRSPELVRLQLDFIKPFRATNISEFQIETSGGATLVTWSMAGKNDFLGKAFGLVMNVDKMVGADFENGLGQIKLLAENGAAKK